MKLTGEKVLGVGDASGMFPIDSNTKDYDAAMLDKFDALAEPYGFDWSLRDILPKVLVAGENAGTLTAEGARLLDTDGELEAGIPVCPPEGDAGTGMAATNSVAVRTGNVSAGTSVFAMIVLEKALKNVHTEIDLVTTPSGEAVAMAHCNNCTSDLNAWVNLFEEFANSFGMKIDKNELFSVLYNKALEGDADCGGLLAYNYFSGEELPHLMRKTSVCPHTGCKIQSCKFHARALVYGTGRIERWSGYPAQRGRRTDRQDVRPWRSV